MLAPTWKRVTTKQFIPKIQTSWTQGYTFSPSRVLTTLIKVGIIPFLCHRRTPPTIFPSVFVENKMINVGLFLERLPAAPRHNMLFTIHMLVLISSKDKSGCFVLVFFSLKSLKGINLYAEFRLHSVLMNREMKRLRIHQPSASRGIIRSSLYQTAANSVTSDRQLGHISH